MSEPVVLFPPYKELIKVSKDWEYGSFHTHEEIAGVLGVEYGSKEYYTNMTRVVDEMAYLGKRIRCQRTEGYYVLNPSEYPEAAYDDTKRATRVLKSGLDNVHTSPVQKMDHSTQKRMENIGVHLGRTYVNLVTAATEVKELAGIQRKQKMLAKGANTPQVK